MTATHKHQTAPTQFVEAAGVRFAYRRFGMTEGIPLVFFQHFTGTMDNWDPAVVDALAEDRPVILFNNAGVSSSGGETPSSVAEMAKHAVSFIDALGLERVDLFGFSLGGFISQQIAIDRPRLVRKLLLIGTGPMGGEGMQEFAPEVVAYFGKKYAVPDERWLDLFFTPTQESQKAGNAFLRRIRARTEGRDPPISEKVAPAQLAAVAAWGAKRDKPFAYLKEIQHPTLVVNGSNDIILPSVNSFILQQHLPNAQLILYPDSNHGSQYHDPELFATHVALFLDDQGH